MKRQRRYTNYRIAQIVAALAFVLLSLGQIAYRYYKKDDLVIVQSEKTEKHNAVFLFIHDGDTAEFVIDGKTVIVRMLAVDCPEHGEPGFEDSCNYTKNRLSNARRITIELDPHSEKYDKYERLLAWIWVDDELLQAKLIENGHASIKYLYENYLYTDYLYRIQAKKDLENKNVTD